MGKIPQKIRFPVWVLGMIPKKSGYLSIGIGYDMGIIPNTKKKTGMYLISTVRLRTYLDRT
jgi:hypothetical protein